MKHRYIVCYDIADAKRLRKVYRTMCGFGPRLQYSVFQVDVDRRGHVDLRAELSALIDPAEDRVMIVDTGPTEGRAGRVAEFLGRDQAPPPTDDAVIV